MYQCGDVISRKVYRCESGYTHSRDTRVLDVVLYEENENGNDIGYDHQFDELCASLPARSCKWVTLRRKDALRYGEEIESWQTRNALVLGNDGSDGGYLIIEFE
jgi:hypothetical protein